MKYPPKFDPVWWAEGVRNVKPLDKFTVVKKKNKRVREKRVKSIYEANYQPRKQKSEDSYELDDKNNPKFSFEIDMKHVETNLQNSKSRPISPAETDQNYAENHEKISETNETPISQEKMNANDLNSSNKPVDCTTRSTKSIIL